MTPSNYIEKLQILYQVIKFIPLYDSRVHRKTKCETHEHFCVIFGNIAILTNLNTLISKIFVAKLNSCVKIVFLGILI